MGLIILDFASRLNVITHVLKKGEQEDCKRIRDMMIKQRGEKERFWIVTLLALKM